MSLANKYRPQTFDEIIEQKHIVPILKANILKWTNVNYLLYWPRWTWKTTSARLIAKWLNCLNLKDWNPCNECTNCIAINNNTTMDVIEIDAASHTWVDNIREEIIEKEMYRPTMLKKKVYIIDEVHMLSKWAFNALLKIMEEPQDYICFILATTEIHKVPDTIISRCQVFNFKKINQESIIKHLEEIAKKENLNYTIEWLELIAKVSEWCMRDAIKYLDQISVLDKIDWPSVSKFLWIVGNQKIEEFIELIKKNIRSDIFKFLEELQNNWTNLTEFAKDILNYCDQNFTKDIEFYSKLSQKIKNIYMEIKNYPQEILAYKVEFSK